MEEKINELQNDLDSINSFSVDNLKKLGSEYLSSKRGHFAKLLDGDDVKVRLGRKGKQLEFEEPIFINTISFISAAEKKKLNINIKVFYVDGSVKEFNKTKTSRHGENRSFISINHLVKSMLITSASFLSEQKIQEILIFGLPLDSLFKIINSYNEFSNEINDFKEDANNITEEISKKSSKLLDDIESFTSEEDSRKQALSELNEDLKKTSTELSDVEEKLTKKENELEGLSGTYNDVYEKKNSLENQVEQLTESKSTLNKSISNLSGELEKLSSRKDLYTEDMKGFNTESNKQLRIYYALLFSSIICLGIIGKDSVEKINVLVNVYENLLANNAKVRGWDLVVMRLPYASIILAVISALSIFAQKLVGKILEINNQKREIIGLSLLARDVTNSSSKGLEMSDHEIYKKRESLKFELLSESIVGSTFRSVKAKRNEVKSGYSLGDLDNENNEETHLQ
ncbi:hypothetical protein ACRXCV_05015 [Halobacteriovorax sp. GFR7]|uniref:hypothetical protein n=1 Tax=unclassified Halobacteriovorax TaxID=2639665 RepID=UPI003D96A6AC